VKLAGLHLYVRLQEGPLLKLPESIMLRLLCQLEAVLVVLVLSRIVVAFFPTNRNVQEA
jgi:hypothetical protein